MSAVPVLGSAGNPGPQNPESKAKTNLIVNYLPQSMNEEEVRNLFGSVGPVQSCKLIKDKLNNISLGYAFINYCTQVDAEKAIQSLNGLPLHSKTIKVSYARPSSVAIKNANLYVAHLPETCTQLELESLFKPYGNIITSKVLVDSTSGLSRGVGFVRFDKHQEAETAITALNGKMLPGCTQQLVVKFENQPKNAAGQDTPTGDNQPSSHPALSLGLGPTRRTYSSSVGGPMRHTIVSMRYNPVSAGTGGSSAAAAGVSPLSGLPGFTGQGWCIFVYNLPETTEDSLLYQLFSPYGAITSVKVIKDLGTGKCKRYGFVNMLNYEEAYQAIVQLNGYQLEGKPLQVSFKSQNKE